MECALVQPINYMHIYKTCVFNSHFNFYVRFHDDVCVFSQTAFSVVDSGVVWQGAFIWDFNQQTFLYFFLFIEASLINVNFIEPFSSIGNIVYLPLTQVKRRNCRFELCRCHYAIRILYFLFLEKVLNYLVSGIVS